MNDVYLLLMHSLDLLTGGSLDYKVPHGKDQSRIEAGLRLAEDDAIHPTTTPGIYVVRSDDRTKKGLQYIVCAEWGNLSCTCEDATIGPSNPVGVCKHQISAIVMEAQRMVFAQIDAREKAEAEAEAEMEAQRSEAA
jgi:hypothetical protein